MGEKRGTGIYVVPRGPYLSLFLSRFPCTADILRSSLRHVAFLVECYILTILRRTTTSAVYAKLDKFGAFLQCFGLRHYTSPFHK